MTSPGQPLDYSDYTGKRVEEHIAIAERIIGKPLPKGVQVHHVDGNHFNNKKTNLIICPSRAYHSLLHMRTEAYDAGFPVTHRKCPYCKQFDDPVNMLQLQLSEKNPMGTCIHRACRAEYLRAYKERVPRKDLAIRSRDIDAKALLSELET